MKLSTSAFLLLLTGIGYAQESSITFVLPEKTDPWFAEDFKFEKSMERARNTETTDSVNLLTHAPRIEGETMFASGQGSLYAAAFTWICFRTPDESHKLFKDIFVESKTTAGKVYGLLGIYRYDRNEFESLSGSLDQNEEITLINGSSSYGIRVRDLLGMIRNQDLTKIVMGIREGHTVTVSSKLKEDEPD